MKLPTNITKDSARDGNSLFGSATPFNPNLGKTEKSILKKQNSKNKFHPN
jgi:hypothetical protein